MTVIIEFRGTPGFSHQIFFFFIFPLVIFDPMFDFHLMSDECNGG